MARPQHRAACTALRRPLQAGRPHPPAPGMNQPRCRFAATREAVETATTNTATCKHATARKPNFPFVPGIFPRCGISRLGPMGRRPRPRAPGRAWHGACEVPAPTAAKRPAREPPPNCRNPSRPCRNRPHTGRPAAYRGRTVQHAAQPAASRRSPPALPPAGTQRLGQTPVKNFTLRSTICRQSVVQMSEAASGPAQREHTNKPTNSLRRPRRSEFQPRLSTSPSTRRTHGRPCTHPPDHTGSLKCPNC